LSNRIAACSARATVAVRNGFHMSNAAKANIHAASSHVYPSIYPLDSVKSEFGI
jgi:hypothetical protein